MQKLSIVVAILAIGSSFAPSGGDFLVRFNGGIGVIPVSSAAGVANEDGTSPSVNRNVVRGINPSGQIWTIADLRAEVSVEGRFFRSYGPTDVAVAAPHQWRVGHHRSDEVRHAVARFM